MFPLPDISVIDGRKHDLLFFWFCRATYDYEKKLYNDHLESLQVMDKNYITMARELEKLRAELSNSANIDRRGGISTIYFTFSSIAPCFLEFLIIYVWLIFFSFK